MKPAIVIAAYNRPNSLQRILYSLKNATFSTNDIPLVVSIDNSGSDDVYNIAKSFRWEYGSYEIIQWPENLGLRKHILSLGDLTQKYGSIILLEDDLFISPFFYDYTLQAQNFYKDSSIIAGISLYDHRFNETAGQHFVPLIDGNDVYFVQLASSWGQSWTYKQWQSFRQWYDKYSGTGNDFNILIPPDVQIWPETSWKKYFIIYLIMENRYFVYPRISLSTNFSDPGVHHKKRVTHLQNPLLQGPKKFHFVMTEESDSKYDAFCEIKPQVLKKWIPDLTEFNFEVDLYGTKSFESINDPYVLSVKNICENSKMQFGLDLKPHELNIRYNIPGKVFSLGKRENFQDSISTNNSELYSYYYNMPIHYLYTK